MQPQAASTIARPFPLLMMPPPLMFGVAFGIGAIVQRIVPVSFGVGGATLAGAVVLAAGVCLGLSLAATFLMRRTTLNPFADPSVLVARGPYRFSRNPMYLSLIIAYLGAALMFGSVWPLVALPVPVAILIRVVIPFEEARMRTIFGASYQDYCARVRRWL